MRRADPAKRFRQRSLLRSADVDALFPSVPTSPEAGERLVEIPIAELWLDDQPRQIVPDEVLADLIAAGQAQPAALLAALKEAASRHPYYRGILQGIADLAKTIAAEGVLEPLLVVSIAGRFIIRDGHRRALASILAGRESVPARLLDEPSDVRAVARQLVVNLQRQDLTALEKGRWLFRLARLVERQVRDERGLPADSSVIEALIRRVPSDDEDDQPERGASAAEREVAAEVRRRVCEMAGLSQRHYYNLLYLNRLSPAARAAGLGLTEGQLRPVTSLPPEEQEEIVSFIARRNLTAREAATLARVARSGDRDAVRRIMARLAGEETERQRTAVSWEPLLHAVPRDLWPRCAALRAELGALPDERRRVRLRAIWEQKRLAEELARQFAEICALYGYDGADAPDPEAP